MKETEITVEVFDDLDFAIKKIESQKFKMVEKYQLNDYYFSKYCNDKLSNFSYPELIKNSFIVRNIIDDKNTTQICYKNKELDSNGNVIQEEKIKTNVNDLSSVLSVFKVSGLNNWCNLENTSYVFKKDNLEFCLQVIKGLGIFIEWEENETMSTLSPYEKFDKLKEYVSSLGLKIGNDFSCKKVYMKYKKEL